MEETLGKRIAQHRKNLKLTQDQLAEKLGLTAQAVSKWENDLSCPDIAMLPRLAAIFGITTDELLGMEQQAPVMDGEVVDKQGVHFDLDTDKGGSWEFRWDAGKKGAIAFALLVLTVGGLLMAARLMSWDVSFWEILWPSAILVFGIKELMDKFSVFGVGVILFGGYFLIKNLGFWEFDIAGELLFPIAILLFGVSLLLDALKKPKKGGFSIVHKGDTSKKPRSKCSEVDGYFTCEQAFGENTHWVGADPLQGGEIETCFGSLTVDLSGCVAVGENCVIEADCSFGELTILVPRKFRVEPHSDTTFASLDISGHPDSEPAGVIRLNADASFGQITVRYI